MQNTLRLSEGCFVYYELFLILFFRAFIIDDLHMFSGDKLHIIFLCPVNTALEDKRHSKNSFEGGIGKYSDA